MLNIESLKYVLFDWDNTLADTRPLLVKTVERVLAEYGLPAWEEAKKKRKADLSFRDNFPLIFKEKAEAAYARYRELYLDEIKNLHPTSGAEDILAYFRQRQIPMLILTNKDRFLLDKEISHLYRQDWFLRIVAGHEAPRDKPYPEHAWYALSGLLSQTEIMRESVWIIGDSEQDSRCADSVGALPVRIGTPIWGEQSKSVSNVVRASNFAEFLAMLPTD